MQYPLIWAALGMGISALAQADTASPPAGVAPGEAMPVLRTSTRLTLAAFARSPVDSRLPSLPSLPSAALQLRLTDALPSMPAASMVSRLGDAARLARAGLQGVAFAQPVAPEQSSAVSALIQQAQFWSSQGRDDLAGEAVAKLFRIAPDNLQGLEMLARIQARMRQPQAIAPILERMRRRYPGAIETRRTETLLRIDGADRDALQAIRQLVRENRNEEAATAMHVLYPDGAPTEDLTLEYWRMVANGLNGTARARAGLREATRQEPGNVRYRLALAEILTARAPVDRRALARIIDLTEVPALSKQARAAWRRALLILDDGAASVGLLRTYLQQEKNDTAVQARLERMLGGASDRGRRLPDPDDQAQRSRTVRLAAGGPDAPATRARHRLVARKVDADRGRGAPARSSTTATASNASNADGSNLVAAVPISDADRASLLRSEADALVAAGRPSKAIVLLEQAAPMAPEDPWLRFDLARLYAKRNDAGDGERADRLFANLVGRQKTDPSALYAYALVNDSRDRPLDALTTLERVPTDAREPKIVQMQRRLWVALHLRQAALLESGGQPAAAREAVRQVAAAIGNDPLLAPQVATALAAQGGDGIAAANALLDLAQTGQPLPPDWLLERAELASRFDDDAAFASALQKAESLPAPTPADTARLVDLRGALLTRQVDALLRHGDASAALALIALDDVANPDNRRLQLLHADAALAAGQFGEAETRYRRVLALEPDNADAGTGLIDSLIAVGSIDAARQEIDRQLAQRRGAAGGIGNDQLASLTARLIDLKEDGEALALIEPALVATPDNVQLLKQAAGIAERMNRPQQAIVYLQRALGDTSGAASAAGVVGAAGAPGAPSAIDAGPGQSTGFTRAASGADPLVETGIMPSLPANGSYRKLAELLDERSTWIAGAIDVRSRSGAQGRSAFSYSELPLEVRKPWPDGSRVFMQASLVRSSAGTLDLAAADDAARFGSVLLCQPLCTVGGVAQHVSGLGLAAGIERGPLRADLGLTPLGFPIQNIVGGILNKGDLGAFSYSVDVSRRAVTGSVLSYAGARDPRSGERWGGVLANGVRVGLSRDAGGSFGAWSSLGLHRLTGTKVQANDRMQLMGGGYWRLINEDNRLLTVGVNAMHWRFSDNAGEYTFGQGGYYSPQRFSSVSLPVSFGQRTARLSYVLRAALSASRSSTAEAAYFPTRPDLQSQAMALAAAGGLDPRYGASRGRGIGRSLSASFEYQMQPRLFVGGRFEIDRSTDYAPNRLMFYVRYDLDHASARPVTFPPEPLVPASQY